jgi:hypothetical protein
VEAGPTVEGDKDCCLLKWIAKKPLMVGFCWHF